MDLLTATPVVLDRGPLASAMRATMSLPLIFPPVQLDGRVLVDGGAMNNVPADVVRAMGAARVVAVNVGDLADRETVDYSLFALAGATLDAMMRANTRARSGTPTSSSTCRSTSYGSLDWRRSAELIEEGYKAAESMRDSLLPLAVSEAEYTRVARPRVRRRRRTALPVPTFARVEGFSSSDERQLSTAARPPCRRRRSTSTRSRPTWPCSPAWTATRPSPGASSTTPPARAACSCTARPKPYGPPFLMLGLNLENTTSEDFRVTLTGRYLALRRHRVRAPSCASTARSARIPGSPSSSTSRLARAAVRRAVRRHRQPHLQRHSRTMRSWRATDRTGAGPAWTWA